MSPLHLPFTRSVHDRAAHRRTEPGLVEELLADPATRAVRVRGARVAVTDDGGRPRPVLAPADAVGAHDDGTWLFLGEHDGAGLLALALPDDGAAGAQSGVDDGSDGRWAGLRELTALDDLEQGIVVEAVALAQWHTAHARCPRCGAPTTAGQAGWTRVCAVEDRELYPRTDPAVIMAVVDDEDRILLAHGAAWPAGRYSTLAGFVEPGEGLEHAVRREVAEETGVVVGAGPDDVLYRGSQAWPFPASLMVGFRARAVRTDVRVDDDEITDARWFTRADLVEAAEAGDVRLPGAQSIARALIEEWYGEELPGAW
ncbi:NAD(+) diphosphatase [Isoptericola variabilis]|uniref:NAD(+) diphosphatase n=1 Tax=Isoptericola variabilis (strain 225) TaxID=743718 RepID=F6FXB2_ISOV2|nr:NAD(+) diphosphatase [Isoptericola variabilis]AEG43615.1 NUDIX hydrolase [Isoptericola variabilis 225]TWH32017.1 NAD+ diphosphatase [Isoptericola variabilis J7]